MQADLTQTEKLVTQINFAAKQLKLTRTELARMLGLHIDDVSDTVQLELLLDSSSTIHHRVERIIKLFQRAERYCAKENKPVAEWFRKPTAALNTSPFNAIVEQGRLEEILALLQ